MRRSQVDSTNRSLAAFGKLQHIPVTGRGCGRPLWGHGPSGQLAAVRLAGGR